MILCVMTGVSGEDLYLTDIHLHQWHEDSGKSNMDGKRGLLNRLVDIYLLLGLNNKKLSFVWKKSTTVCVWECEREEGRKGERKRMSVYTRTRIQNSNFPHVIIHTGSSLFLKNKCTTSSRICFPPSLTINPLERIFVAQKNYFS